MDSDTLESVPFPGINTRAALGYPLISIKFLEQHRLLAGNTIKFTEPQMTRSYQYEFQSDNFHNVYMRCLFPADVISGVNTLKSSRAICENWNLRFSARQAEESGTRCGNGSQFMTQLKDNLLAI